MKDKEIEELRRKEYFLPLYSDYYFEKKRRTRDVILSISIYAFITFLLINAFTEFKETFAIVCFGIVLIVIFYNTILYGKFMNRKKVLGFTLKPDGAIKKSFFGVQKKIFYYDLEQEIISGHMEYEETGIGLGKRKNKLVFHYEIGDSKAQKHVEECYKELQKYIQTKLLPYEKKGLEILDKKFYYDRSRKRQTISLFIALLFFQAYAAGNGLGSVDIVIFCGLIMAPWEYFSLYVLAKNAALTKDTHAKMQELLVEYPGIRLKGKYAGWIRFIIMAVLVICVNCLIILKS